MQPTLPTPEQIANVTEAITAALWLGVALAIYAYLSHRTEDNGPTRWQRWRAWIVEHYFLSSSDSTPGADAAGIEPVYIPVSETGIHADTSAPIPAPADRAAPDIEAPNRGMDDDGWQLPRVSRHISDGELIVLLAALRAPSGKHRFSANQIAALVGGNRNTVMARVKELRADAPLVYPPRTPEQQIAREQLQLDRR